MKLTQITYICLIVSFLSPGLVNAQQTDGERLFGQRCGTCHSMDSGKNLVAPSLANVMGQPAARIEGARYSDALINSGIVWDKESLDAFLANPQALVPGTRMNVNVPNREQRAAIIDFLSSQE